MKILTALGSARKRGNTAQALGWLEDRLTASGHEVERLFLPGLNIKGCLGCGICRQNTEEPACVQTDDGVSAIEKMIVADVVVFASPLYFWGFSAPMKAFIDRSYCLVNNYGKPEHHSLVANQRQALLITAADSLQGNGEEVVTSFRRIADYAKAVNVGELFIGDCAGKGDLDDEAKRQAEELAVRIMDAGAR